MLTTLTYLSAVGGIVALIYAIILAVRINKMDSGTKRMKEIAQSINEGAKAFLFSEYKILVIFVATVFIVISVCGIITKSDVLNYRTALAFLIGAILSTLAGYCGMSVATKANVRTANAAKEKGMNSALSAAFSGGAVMGMCVSGLGLLGVCLIYAITGDDNILFGFSLGASSIALFAFLKDKIRFLSDKYESTVNKVTSFFIAVEKENKLFLNSLLCEDYDELLKLEEKVNNLQDSSVKDLILGDILYKKGESKKAIESYIKATENTDNDKTLCILKYRFFSDLEKLDSYLEQVNFLRKLNIETRKEEEASEERKAIMRKNMFEQWKAPYKDSKTISKIYSKVSLIDKMFVGEEIDLTTMIDIIEEVGAYADPEVKTTPIVLGKRFRNTVDGPQHTDHNLVAPGDSNVW